ncbi:MAG TPA: ABC transporter ATP-binding protein [Spirochaetes bacterium]|nr:ABC transporter ATP-binding protein [Spirochaetota bacterium]
MNERGSRTEGALAVGLDATAGTPAVELSGISKAFPGVVANNNISLTVWPGEVHCLLGENGAGKSTLMQILSGMYHPDMGTIRMFGREVRINSPRQALELGVGMVYQHSTLIPVFSVLENLLLGSRGLILDRQGALKRFREYSDLLGVDIDPGALVGNLALGQQQQVEIIKTLWKGSSVLILDEPTSMLTPQAIEELKEVVAQLKQSGLAVIFITHKLHEAMEIGDRISVLRGGRLVGSTGPSVLSSADSSEIRRMVIEMMFGKEMRAATNVAEARDHITGKSMREEPAGRPVLELVDVSVEAQHDEAEVQGVSFCLHAGEILGVAGVDGNGQRELAEAIAGQRRVTAGDILLNGSSISGCSVSDRQKMGLRYVTDDRMGEGICRSLSVGRNMFLKRIGQKPFWNWGRADEVLIQKMAEKLIQEYDIHTPGVESRCGTLSGGNIQKVLLARELLFDPKVVVFSKPTHGLDLKTTGMVRERIRCLAEEEGVAELLISTDLDEVLDLADRIAVMYRGRISGIVDNREGIEKTIGELMVGGSL